MKNLLICYPKCSTCRKAVAWLEESGIEFDYRDIKLENPDAQELKKYHEMSRLPLKKFFNTSGMIYRESGLKDRRKEMSDEEMYELLSTDGMLVKRPILVTGECVLVGFKENEWKEALLINK